MSNPMASLAAIGLLAGSPALAGKLPEFDALATSPAGRLPLALHAAEFARPVASRPVETDEAAKAAARIAELL